MQSNTDLNLMSTLLTLGALGWTPPPVHGVIGGSSRSPLPKAERKRRKKRRKMAEASRKRNRNH